MVRKLWRKAWRKWSEHCTPKEEKTTSADDPEILRLIEQHLTS